MDGIIVLLKIIGEIFLSIIKIVIKDPPKDISGEIVLVSSRVFALFFAQYQT